MAEILPGANSQLQNVGKPQPLTEDDWKMLLERIRQGKCTPFLGAGVNYGVLPLGPEIARDWAKNEGYPLTRCDDLPSVAQFLAIRRDPMWPKEQILRRLRERGRPDFNSQDPALECLRALAELPLPVYLTTNYDDFMVEALKHTEPPKQPRREVCRWHPGLKKLQISAGSNSKSEPDHANPLVFHLHGSDEESMSLVLTEDDYFSFLVNISKYKILPPRVERALTDASLLFIGYSLKDIDFQVIYRGLVQSMDSTLRRFSITVQLYPPEDHSGDCEAAVKYRNSYFENLKVRVYWGTAGDFAKELRDRWRTFNGNVPNR